MKKLLASKLLLITLILVSTSALAHTGHLANDAVHGFLHIEHIIVLAAAGLIAYFLKTLNNK
jgi:hypothetical protein